MHDDGIGGGLDRLTWLDGSESWFVEEFDPRSASITSVSLTASTALANSWSIKSSTSRGSSGPLRAVTQNCGPTTPRPSWVPTRRLP